MDFTQMIEEERQRLTKKLEDIAERRVALDQEESAVTIEMQALTAYFDTKLGKVTQRQAVNSKPRKVRGPRRETSVKATVLSVIQEFGAPIGKQDILAAMKAEDNKSLQNGISNALVQLKKAGTVVSGERGMYQIPSEVKEEPKKAPRRVPKDETAHP